MRRRPVARLATVLLPTLLLGALLLPSSAGAAGRVTEPSDKVLYNDGHDDRMLLDGAWLRKLDPLDQGETLGFQSDTLLVGWGAVSVPNAWNTGDESEQSQRGGVAWYRKDFRLPKKQLATTWKFRFESVNYRAKVWLNGEFLGDHEGAYLPFEINSSRVRRKGVNRLVVRVDSRRTASDVPGMRDQSDGKPGGGWWNYGGLLREVYLRPIRGIDIDELEATPELRCSRCNAVVRLRARLENPKGGKRKVKLVVAVGNKTARFREVQISSGKVRIVTSRVKIRKPRLWRITDPELYSVRARAMIRRRTVASYSTNIGIRSIKVKAGRVLLNGKRVRLNGTSMHEDFPGRGAALRSAERKKFWRVLRGMNTRLLREHYPVHPWFLEQADRSGVMVWDQIPFFRPANSDLRSNAFRAKGYRMLKDMIRRDRNHASVLSWSIGNELPSIVRASQTHYINGAVNTVRALDRTRLVSQDIVGYPQTPYQKIYEKLDALGVNPYFGWYAGRQNATADREGLGAYLDQVRSYYPGLALFVTEFGAEANRDGAHFEKGTYDFQRRLLAFHIGVHLSKSFINGSVVSIFNDFHIRPGWEGGNPDPSPPYVLNQKGVVDNALNPKLAYRTVAKLFGKAEQGKPVKDEDVPDETAPPDPGSGTDEDGGETPPG